MSFDASNKHLVNSRKIKFLRTSGGRKYAVRQMNNIFEKPNQYRQITWENINDILNEIELKRNEMFDIEEASALLIGAGIMGTDGKLTALYS